MTMDFLDAFAAEGAFTHRRRGIHLFSDSPFGDPNHLSSPVVGVVDMSPAIYLGLVPPLDHPIDTSWFGLRLRLARQIRPACLEVEFEPDGELDSYPRVTGHDGRHRMTAMAGLIGPDTRVPVVIRSTSPIDDARALALRTALWSQPSDTGPVVLVRGPIYGDLAVPGRVMRGIGVDELHAFLR